MAENVRARVRQRGSDSSPLRIAIVITCFNKGKALARAVKSAYNQDTPASQVIVVDDCSTDLETLDVLNAVERIAHSPKLIRLDQNRGAAGAKNVGVRASKAEIIMLLDADDELTRDSVREVLDFFEKNRQADFAYGDVIRYRDQTATLMSGSDFTDSQGKVDKETLALNWELHGTSPFKRSLFERIGGFDELHPRTDDSDFFKRAIFAGAQGGYIPQTIYIAHLDHTANSVGIEPLTLSFSWFRNIEFYAHSLGRVRFIYLFVRKTLLLLARLSREWFRHNAH